MTQKIVNSKTDCANKCTWSRWSSEYVLTMPQWHHWVQLICTFIILLGAYLKGVPNLQVGANHVQPYAVWPGRENTLWETNSVQLKMDERCIK
jgi:hypothetical protein